jgi:uncharacterized repeat protein (TIGR01451 family)
VGVHVRGGRKRTCPRPFGISIFAALLALGAVAGTAAAQTSDKSSVDSGNVTAQAEVAIASAGPLNNIYLNDQLNCQVDHVGDADHEFYGGVPGACATLIATGGTLYGPSAIPAGGSAAPRTTYTTVSMSGITGSGASGDPYTVVTVVDAGTSGLRLTETDTYVVGTESYRTDVQVSNTTGAPVSFVLYRAGDCFLQGSDVGFGDLLPDGSVGCHASDDGGISPGLRIERWIPITGGSAAYEAGYDDVWAAIGSQTAFPNTCLCDQYIDNGAGLSWSGTVAAGTSATYSHLTVFSPMGITGPYVTKTAAADTVSASGSDSYTITINNPTGGDLVVTSITDHLPAGFHYVAGSTTGLTTSEPTVSGQDVTWTGSFSVPAAGSAGLTFGVVASSETGTYTNSADAVADQTVAGSGATAPVTVTPIIVLQPRFTG